MNQLWLYFEYAFIWRALLVGLAVAISASLLGPFLVLKKFALIGDGLAHVSYLAVALSLLLNDWSFYVAIPLIILSAIIIIKLNAGGWVHGDAAIGLMSSFSIALGTILMILNPYQSIKIDGYLFGNILLLLDQDIWMSLLVALGVVLTISLFYRELFALTYESEFAKINGIHESTFHYVLAILVAVTIYLGIRSVGVLLISSLIIFPTTTASQVCQSFKQLVFASLGLSIVNFFLGFLLSLALNLPAGPTIVLINGVSFIIAFGIRRIFLPR